MKTQIPPWVAVVLIALVVLVAAGVIWQYSGVGKPKVIKMEYTPDTAPWIQMQQGGQGQPVPSPHQATPAGK